MHSIKLPAHFDGEKILLDKPFELQPNMKLLITVVPNKPAPKPRQKSRTLTRSDKKRQAASWWQPMQDCSFSADFFGIMDNYLAERKSLNFQERELFD